MAKPDQKFFDTLLAKAGITVEQDLTSAKPSDVYFMHFDGSVSLDKPFAAQLSLPPGDFMVVAQAVLNNNDTSAHYFYAQLSYSDDSTTVADVRGGKLASTANGLPYSIFMNCALTSQPKKPVKFTLGSDAEVGFAADEVKITAVRVSSLTTFLKSVQT